MQDSEENTEEFFLFRRMRKSTWYSVKLHSWFKCQGNLFCYYDLRNSTDHTAHNVELLRQTHRFSSSVYLHSAKMLNDAAVLPAALTEHCISPGCCPSTSAVKGAIKVVALRNNTCLPAPTPDPCAAGRLLGKKFVLQRSEPL